MTQPGNNHDPSDPELLPTSSEPAPSSRSLILKAVLGLAALVGLFLLARQAGGYIPAFAAWVDGLGFWAPVVFGLGYAVATVAFVPGSLLTLAGGAVFGLVKGSITVFLGATLGATGAFLVARYVARRPIERRLSRYPRFDAIDKAVTREGRKIVFLLRLSPVFPFVLLNYGLGLTRVKLLDYVIASLGMIPGTVLYVYYGKVVGDVATLASGVETERGWQYYTVLGLGIVATLVVTTFITRIARKALRDL